MFCQNCGTQLNDTAKFCVQCGTATSGAPTTAFVANSSIDQKEKTYKVSLFRRSELYLINGPINICIDGEKNLSIDNSKNLEIHLAPGPHNIKFYQSFRKRILDIDLQHDINIMISWNRLTGALNANIQN